MQTLSALLSAFAHAPQHIARRRTSLRVELCEQRLAMAAEPLVITELMYAPAAITPQEDAAGFKRDDFEFIELQNVSGQSLPINGFSLDDGIEFTFCQITLAPNQRVVVVRDSDAFAARYGTSATIAGEYKGTLSNGSDTLILTNASGGDILDFTYDEDWYPSTSGDGHSLVILNPNGDAAQWDNPQAWRASSIIGGTPGQDEGPVDQTPPSVPQGLSASLTGAQIALQWQPAVDGESAITGYRIYRDGTLLDTTTATTLTDSTALANSSYVYRVAALNAFGLESGQSNSASVSIPPVGDNPAFAAGKKVGDVTEIELVEISGMVASRKNHDVLWVHEDGSQNTVVAINATGRYLGTLTLSGIQSTDWEDIAIGPGPVAGIDYLYIADIGDNLADRGSITIYRVPEPAIQSQPGSNQSVTLSRSQFDVITLHYPSGAVDAEALLVDPLSGDLFILTKEASPSRIFRAPASSLVNGSNVALAQVGQVDFKEPSAAEISPSGREIIVRNETEAQIFLRAEGQSVAAALAGTPFDASVIGPPKEPNGEAIGFEWSGRGYYTISEDQDPALYYFHRTSRLPGDPGPTTGTWHNSALPADVNGDGRVEAIDVLVLVNDINLNGSRQLAPPSAGGIHAYLDVDANDFVSALDVLIVVNHLNNSSSLTAQAQLTPIEFASDTALTLAASPTKSRDHVITESDWRDEVQDARRAATSQQQPGVTAGPERHRGDRLGIRARRARAALEPVTLD